MKKIFFSLLLFTAVNKCEAQSSTQFYEKGKTLKTDSKINEAIAEFKEAVRLDAKFRDAWYELGWCYNDIEEYKNALASLRTARNLGLETSKMFFELAYAFEKTGNDDSAINNYKRCLAINPDYSSVNKRLGYIAYAKEDYVTAIQYFDKFEVINKTPIEDYYYWYRKGYAYNALKKFEAAKTSLNKSLQFKQDYISTYLEIGFACYKLSQNDEAISNYQKAINIDSKNHIPYNGIGDVYRDNIKNMDNAMEWYRKTLAFNPTERKANYGVCYCLNSNGKYSEAIPYIQKAIDNETNYTAAYVEIGYSYYMTSNNVLALENLKKAISISPLNENARYYAALVYINQGNRTLAQKMTDELKQLGSTLTDKLQEKVNKM